MPAADKPPASAPRAATWRRYSGALLVSGFGLVLAAAWYHFRGIAPEAATLAAVFIGIALFTAGIVAGRKSRPAGSRRD